MRILVTYAVQGEFTELKFPGIAARVVLKELRKRNYLIFNKLKKKSQLC